MPPKKKLCKSNDQRSISEVFGFSKTNNATSVIAPSNKGETQNETKKPPPNKFLSKWLKLYSWLAYNEEKDFMYCTVCSKLQKKNGMVEHCENRNFKKTTLDRHAVLPDHQAAIQAPSLSNDFNACQAKASTKEDKAVTVLMKVVKWLCDEDIPLSKYKSMINLLHDLGVPDISVLQTGINYDSQYTAYDLLDSLSAHGENELNQKMCDSPAVTLLADESTDISNTKRLVIYTQIIDERMVPSTHYVCNVECTDATGKGIAKSILSEIESRGVSTEKIMSFGSDGASVMTGKHNGTAAILRRVNPHMTNVHCIAHRWALCTSQASDSIPHLKQHQQTLTDLFYYFKGSSKREHRLREIQLILDDPVITVKELHSVRWLSYFNALQSIYRLLDSLLTYLQEAATDGKDPKAVGLKKKVGNDKFLAITYMMMDAMSPVTAISQFFQTENVDIALVKVKVDLCISDLEKVKGLETPYMQELSKDLEGNSFKGHHIIKSPLFDIQALAASFIDTLQSNIKKRFPENEMLQAFGALEMRPISFLSKEDRAEWGINEIKQLGEHYGATKEVTWEDENRNKVSESSDPVIDSEKCLEEWGLVKEVVLAEHYPRDSMSSLWQLIAKYHMTEFPNLIKLAQLALTSAVHTAGCERGFSAQNAILTKGRNRLLVENQHKLMRVKMSSSIDYEQVISIWRQKSRRLYKAK